ncbi:hypothetical protein [Fluviispira vulneris]|uniref:hypothetical protein n=1 Tax=Fluviispira vulneris TaxID=2763012 RepID=UPI0016497639|nr:hypothetical protein [Fluviispira vulneris]
MLEFQPIQQCIACKENDTLLLDLEIKFVLGVLMLNDPTDKEVLISIISELTHFKNNFNGHKSIFRFSLQIERLDNLNKKINNDIKSSDLILQSLFF